MTELPGGVVKKRLAGFVPIGAVTLSNMLSADVGTHEGAGLGARDRAPGAPARGPVRDVELAVAPNPLRQAQVLALPPPPPEKARAALIVPLAILEAAALLCGIAFLLTPAYRPLVAAAIPLGTMLAWFPRAG